MSFDADAQAYINAVIAVDGFMWPHVQEAVNTFVVGCKADASPLPGVSNWAAIKASCLLAGAQTLAGALVPLKGAAPTVSGISVSAYHPVNGLRGNGSGHLWANRNNNEDPQNNNHNAVFSTEGASGYVIGTTQGPGANNIGATILRCRSSAFVTGAATSGLGLLGISRHQSASFISRLSGAQQTHAIASDGVRNEQIMVFGRNTSSPRYEGRLSFYSIGEAVDLALLDSRVTKYMQDIAMPARRGFPLSRLVN